MSGPAELSVKQLPISKLPSDRNEPIINAVPPDLLHLRTRIAEKLFRGLIAAAGGHEKNKFAPRFQELVRSAGVPFKIAETLVHGKPQIGFTPFTGRRWKQVLPKLPGLIRHSDDVFDHSHKELLATLLEQFDGCLSLASGCTHEDAASLASKTHEWMNTFLKLGAMGLTHFQPKDVTPYCHWLNVHVPFAVSLFGGLSKLSGELLERQNDHIKQTFLRRTHHRDPKQTLQVEKRRELQLMMKEIDDAKKPRRVKKDGCLHPWYF